MGKPSVGVAKRQAGSGKCGRSVNVRGAGRYLRLVYTVATGPMTAGKVIAGLVLPGAVEDSARAPYGHGLVGSAA